MLKTRRERQAADAARAVTRVADIHSSTIGLSNDDLLDLADIFASGPATSLKGMSAAEMTRRSPSL